DSKFGSPGSDVETSAGSKKFGAESAASKGSKGTKRKIFGENGLEQILKAYDDGDDDNSMESLASQP
ncbi:hypothetical protein A2U01_0119474, partial [Trifolium medium]|nr:hypothetical protein [Trifolium medium]